jgi:hypothetical protein
VAVCLCDDCGKAFATLFALQRHVKLWCPKRTSLKRKREDDDDDNCDDVKSKKWIDYEGDEDEEVEDNEESAGRVYGRLLDLAKALHDDERQQNIDKYVNEEGMTEEDAEDKVETVEEA